MRIEKEFFRLLLFAGASTFIFFDGFKKWRRKRLIENIPTSKIRSMAMGLVELQGKALERVLLLKGPLTGKNCVFYKYQIERFEHRGKSSRWITIAGETSCNSPFYLDDNTGKVLIDPKGVETHLKNPDFQYESGRISDIPSHIEVFLQKNEIQYKSFFGKHRLRFREWLICPGDEIYVLGAVRKNESFISDFKLRLSEELRKIKTNPEEMKKIDTDNDGTVSVSEWEAAVQITRANLMEQELQNTNTPPETNLVIAKGDEDTIFILSEKSEKELTESLYWWSIGEIAGGAALAIFCLYFLIADQ